ncbi:hypothetical protein MINTM021_05070 [Mycobacterium paraintracellulare]|nr:hypothetical protein MINTM021_05070 [Mycobacterium paraintracellulare]
MPEGSRCGARHHHGSKQMVPTNQRRVDRRGVGACVTVRPERRAYQREAGLPLGLCGLLDGRPCAPPTGPVLNSRVGIEDGDRAPSDAETDVDVRGEQQADGQCRVDGGPDGGVAALELVADGEGGRVDRAVAHFPQSRGQGAVQPGAIGGMPGTDDITDQRRAR